MVGEVGSSSAELTGVRELLSWAAENKEESAENIVEYEEVECVGETGRYKVDIAQVNKFKCDGM